MKRTPLHPKSFYPVPLVTHLDAFFLRIPTGFAQQAVTYNYDESIYNAVKLLRKLRKWGFRFILKIKSNLGCRAVQSRGGK